MTTISVEPILRSRNGWHELSTFLMRYPRFIHAEFMTHRMLSKNSASSRAIPVEKLIKDVRDNPVTPITWGKNQKGMQAYEEVDEFNRALALLNWESARDNALDSATKLAACGLHKQIVNRILEPFAHITVLVSGTEWDNFLELRDHDAAEPHIRRLAECLRRELDREDNVYELQPGEWHMPFITPQDHMEVINHWRNERKVMPTPQRTEASLRRLSVARCASTSYKTVDGFDMTFQKADALFNGLVKSTPIHASPLEHVAQVPPSGYGGSDDTYRQLQANFRGFRQLRHMPNFW